MNSKMELFDFELLFESEPVWIHEGGWFYGARFIIQRGEDRLEAVVAPDEGEFSLVWCQGERMLMNLRFVAVVEWYIQRRDGSEQLVVKTRGEREALCVVIVNPDICVMYEGQW